MLALYYFGGIEDQAAPPSVVSNVLLTPVCWSATNQIVAWKASLARTPVRSLVTGEFSFIQCSPPSVVRKMVPELPTIQQTFAETAEPAKRSVSTPLTCGVHVTPLSFELSSDPAGPARQACFPLGAQKTWGFCKAAARIIARALAGLCGSAETSTVSFMAEIASALAAFSLGAATLGAAAGAGDGTLPAAPAEVIVTAPSSRKPGWEGGGGGGDFVAIALPSCASWEVISASRFF